MVTDTSTAKESEFEVVDFTPALRYNTKSSAKLMELLELLLKVPLGKSIRRTFSEFKEGKRFEQGVRQFLKRKGINQTYFVRLFRERNKDGVFEFYIGRKDEK